MKALVLCPAHAATELKAEISPRQLIGEKEFSTTELKDAQDEDATPAQTEPPSTETIIPPGIDKAAEVEPAPAEDPEEFSWALDSKKKGKKDKKEASFHIYFG